MAPVLPLLERLSLYPAETLLAVPVGPEQSVRGVLVLGGIVRQLEADARALKAEQAEVAALQGQLDAELPRLAAAQATQAQAETALDGQIAQARDSRRAAEDAGADAARHAAASASRAESLRAAIAQIEADRRAAEQRARAEADAADRARRLAAAQEARVRQAALARPAGPGLGAPQGALMQPVVGSVLRGYGEAADAGPATGVSYQAAPGARVVSPCGGGWFSPGRSAVSGGC